MSAATDQDSNKNDIVRTLIVNIGNHYFGAPIADIHDVIQRQATTAVPHAQHNIIGLLNLRGHIVTEIDMAKTLEISLDNQSAKPGEYSVVINHQGELYSLVFDGIGDVIDIPANALERLPETVNRRWFSMAKGVHRLPDKLLVVLDLTALVSQITGQAQSPNPSKT